MAAREELGRIVRDCAGQPDDQTTSGHRAKAEVESRHERFSRRIAATNPHASLETLEVLIDARGSAQNPVGLIANLHDRRGEGPEPGLGADDPGDLMKADGVAQSVQQLVGGLIESHCVESGHRLGDLMCCAGKREKAMDHAHDHTGSCGNPSAEPLKIIRHLCEIRPRRGRCSKEPRETFVSPGDGEAERPGCLDHAVGRCHRDVVLAGHSGRAGDGTRCDVQRQTAGESL